MTPAQIAQQRIDECCRSQAKALDLSGLGLSEIPAEVIYPANSGQS